MMRLLFVKLRHIGDALLLTPTLAAVKQAMPKAEIWVVVRGGCEGILAGCPHIDQLRTAMIPERGKAREAHRGADWRLLRELRAARFEHAFELSGGDRGRWMVALSGTRGRSTTTSAMVFPKHWKIAFNRPAVKRRYGYHEVQRDYMTVREILSLPDVIPPLTFIKEAMLPWKPAEEVRDFAVIHPGTRWAKKAWSEARWVELGRALLKRVPYVVVSVGPDAEERALGERIRAALGTAVFSTDGQTSWAQLAGLLQRAKFFVGVDTAAMHLAAACDCPTVALFGDSKVFEWYPWRVRHRLIRAHQWLSEKQCSSMSGEALMDAIPCERVLEAVEDVLAGGGVVRPTESRLVPVRNF